MTRKNFLHFIHDEDYYGIDDHITFNEEKRAGSHEHSRLR